MTSSSTTYFTPQVAVQCEGMNAARTPIDDHQIATPALVILAPVVRRNIERLAEYGKSTGLKIRPHTKTHKLRQLARMQLDAGAIGLTAAKVSEAEAISDPNEDVLIAYPPIGLARAERVAALARDRKVRAALDSVTAVEMISAAAVAANTTVGLLVDLDVGLKRTGVQTSAEALKLAQAIDRAPGVRLDGIMIYPGQVWEPPTQQSASLSVISALLNETLDLWRDSGLAAEIVSGGSTPTAFQSHHVPQLTEIRPGSYVFNDMNTVRGEFCGVDDCAARVVATVISTAIPGQVVLDAGSKSLARDAGPTPESGFGHVVEYPEATIPRLSEEHAQVNVTRCSKQPSIGERVTVIPNHICPCVNLQDAVWWVEDHEPPRMLEVTARGMVQ